MPRQHQLSNLWMQKNSLASVPVKLFVHIPDENLQYHFADFVTAFLKQDLICILQQEEQSPPTCLARKPREAKS